MAPDDLPAALAHFGITADAIDPLTGGAVNAHWRVRAGEQRYVLRRYNGRHDPAGTAYEHAVLAHLAGRGWPVAVPILAVDGSTVVEEGGHRYALFPFLSGRPAPPGNLDMLRTKGMLLAHLHRDLAAWPAPGQRPGFGRVTDLDRYLAPDRFATLDALLEHTARDDPRLVDAVRRERAANLDELGALGFDQVPDTPIHFEFYGANLLFEDGSLSAVLDWDFVHLDARLADIGRSIAIDGTARDGGIDPAALTAFLGGYMAESPLTETELPLIVPLIRANLLWLVALPLSLWASGDPAPYLLPSARRTATVQLPHLRAQQPELEAAVRAVTGA
ncbi:MAG: phosphotransferase [Dehalococcoidia bacterium]